MEASSLDASSEGILVDIMFANAWSHVAHVRRMVDALVQSTCQDADHTWRISLSAHELMENAVKFGRGMTRLRVYVDGETGQTTRVEVSNESTPEDHEHVARILAMLRQTRPDLAAARYRELMVETAAKERGSGLGLPRIAFEARMLLECSMADGRLAVCASPQTTLQGELA